MFGDVIVPLDGSEGSARALPTGISVAKALDSALHVVSFTNDVDRNGDDEASELRAQVAEAAGARGVAVPGDVSVLPVEGSVGASLATWLADRPGDLVVMASHGRGRSAAVVGSVAGDVLAHRSAPVLIVGPDADADFDPAGPMIVPLDTSERSEEILPVAEAWAIVFHNRVELVQVLDPGDAAGASRSGESGYLRRIANGVSAQLAEPPSFDVLHDTVPGRGVVRHAGTTGAALIAMTTHGATGRGRLLGGSVLADVVRHARCPVLALRPPTLR